MSKNTYFTGQPLYTQLLKFADRQEGLHDRYVKKLDGYAQFVIMLPC